jgi:hypothetical protein
MSPVSFFITLQEGSNCIYACAAGRRKKTMSNIATVDMETLRRALEQRDTDLFVSLLADNAELQVIDKLHPPKSPLELRGKQAIAEYLTDINNRDMTHRVTNEVVGKDRLSYNEICQYASGERVFAASVVDLQNGRIIREVIVDVWDE